MSADGEKRYLIREDMTNLEYLIAYNDSKPWTMYIDELLSRLGGVTNIADVISNMLHAAVSSEQWCTIPSPYVGLYNYSSLNTNNVLRNNISQWLPCGVHVSQMYLRPDVQEEVIVIKVNAQHHINLTFIEVHMDSTVLEVENELLMPHNLGKISQ